MNAQEWRRVERVLDVILDAAPEQWDALLEQTCGGDEALRRNVSSLLRRLGTAEHFLTTPPVVAAAALAKEARARVEIPGFEGRRIGAYRLVRQIGSGGMARVFLAERADGQFRQEVALKLMRPGSDSDRESARFRAERQILASLRHPSIARLLDGGVTDDGLQYLALEHVDGQPIDAYCDERRLPVSDRLELFLEVAEATQYAHRNLIVHRDLKPSNIYVTSEGRVKLLDFGIAKLLEPEAYRVTAPSTRMGQRWMTPEYAAPEQIRGDPVTTATDVYQLGVVLYQLLCARLPFETDGARLHDLERAVLETEPAPPSSTLASRTQRERDTKRSVIEISVARGTGPDQLRRALRGDLDAIVLKALRKEPEARYASAQEMADDVRRYLSGHAVLARGHTAGYRVRRFARRHRWVLAAAAAFVLLLGAYAVTVTAQAREVTRALNRATLEARKAEQVTDFMLSLFEANDPAETLGDTVTAAELLERGVARTRWLDGQPVVQAQMLGVIGRIRMELGAYDQAEPILEQALSTRRRTLGNDHPDVAETLFHLANLAHLRGESERAATLHREALGVRRAAFGNRDPRTLESLFALATTMHESGEHAAAGGLFEEWIAAQSTRVAEHTPESADQLESLGTLLMYSGELDRAEPLLRRVVEIRTSLYGRTHPQVAVSLVDVGVLLEKKGDLATSQQLMRDALAIWRAVYPEDHPQIGAGLEALAGSLWKAGDLDGAESLYREALEIGRNAHGENHEIVVSIRRLLGRVLTEKGAFTEADSLIRDVLAHYRHRFGEDNLLTVRARFYLGDLLRRQGRFDEAEPLMVDSYRQYLQRWGATSPRTRSAAEALVLLYEAAGRPEDAARYRSAAGPGH